MHGDRPGTIGCEPEHPTGLSGRVGDEEVDRLIGGQARRVDRAARDDTPGGGRVRSDARRPEAITGTASSAPPTTVAKMNRHMKNSLEVDPYVPIDRQHETCLPALLRVIPYVRAGSSRSRPPVWFPAAGRLQQPACEYGDLSSSGALRALAFVGRRLGYRLPD